MSTPASTSSIPVFFIHTHSTLTNTYNSLTHTQTLTHSFTLTHTHKVNTVRWVTHCKLIRLILNMVIVIHMKKL